MNKKHNDELILDLYYNKKKSLFSIAKSLGIAKSSVGYIVQKHREGEPFKEKQRLSRLQSRTYQQKYKSEVEKNELLKQENNMLKKQLNAVKYDKQEFTLPSGLK